MARNTDIQDIDSFISKEAYFKGNLSIKGSLRIDGHFQGNIDLEKDLLVGETGKVKTNIYARRVIIRGLFIGNIEAKEEILLQDSAKVIGNIRTSNLFVDKGAVVLGKVQISTNEYNFEQLVDVMQKKFLKEIPNSSESKRIIKQGD